MSVVAKEISLEDVRLGIEKLPGRFYEHPATVFVISNLNYADAPYLTPHALQPGTAVNWQELRLTGNSTQEYAEQIDALGPVLTHGWQTRPSPKTGNPIYARPTVLVIYREDHEFMLDAVIPRPGKVLQGYDLILASQPWRARMSAEFKARTVLAPLTRALAPGGRLLAIQSCGHDPALKSSSSSGQGKSLPGGSAPAADRTACRTGRRGRRIFLLDALPTASPSCATRCTRCLRKSAIASAPRRCSPPGMPPSTFNQIEDERLDSVITNGAYLDATQAVLQKHGGLWFQRRDFRRGRGEPRAGSQGRRPTAAGRPAGSRRWSVPEANSSARDGSRRDSRSSRPSNPADRSPPARSGAARWCSHCARLEHRWPHPRPRHRPWRCPCRYRCRSGDPGCRR